MIVMGNREPDRVHQQIHSCSSSSSWFVSVAAAHDFEILSSHARMQRLIIIIVVRVASGRVHFTHYYISDVSLISSLMRGCVCVFASSSEIKRFNLNKLTNIMFWVLFITKYVFHSHKRQRTTIHSHIQRIVSAYV